MDVCRYSHVVYHRNRKQTRTPAEPHSRTFSSTHLTLNEESFRVLNSEPALGWLTTCGHVAGPQSHSRVRSCSSSVFPFFLLLLVCLCPCFHPHVVVIYRLLEISSATSLLHSKTTLQVIAGIFYYWQLLMISQLRSFLTSYLDTYVHMTLAHLSFL